MTMDLEFHQLDLRYEHLRVRRPDKERRLLASLAGGGQQVPIVVVALADEPNRFLVIDGFKRIRALRRLDQDTVSATLWDLDQAEALMLDRSLRTAEAETAIEQGWLLSELHSGFGLTLEDLARRFDRSTSWVSRRLALVEELPSAVQEKVRRGEIAAHVAGKYLVPMARAKPSDCEQLAEAIAHYKFSSQEVGQLYAAWRDGPLHLRRRVLEDPKLFLRARREIEQQEPVAVRATDDLIRDLELVSSLARRAHRHWRQAATIIDAAEREKLGVCLQQALEDLQKLSKSIERENSHVESKPADDDSRVASPGNQQASDCPNPAGVSHVRQEGHPFSITRGPAVGPGRESHGVPARDPATLCQLPRQPGPGP